MAGRLWAVILLALLLIAVGVVTVLNLNFDSRNLILGVVAIIDGILWLNLILGVVAIIDGILSLLEHASTDATEALRCMGVDAETFKETLAKVRKVRHERVLK